jgi:hypothetical protein
VEAGEIVEEWRVDYDTARPRSSLGNMTPEEYAERLAARPNPLSPEGAGEGALIPVELSQEPA